MKLEFHPLTLNRWPSLEKLFGERGGCGGCWCMWWRLSHSQWVRQKGKANQQAFRQIVKKAEIPPGLLAYSQGRPVGWCALAPRSHFPRLANSRILKAVDDAPVWSVTCFFVKRKFRRQRVSLSLLKEAARFAKAHGARVLEGYPSEAKGGYPDVFYYVGLVSAFRKAGFKEVARRSPLRPIFRCPLA